MEVKFELSQGGHIDIPVHVNDEGPFRFKVDTGAAATALTQSLVEQLGIQTSLDETGKFDDIGFLYEIAELDSLTIESIVREKEEVIVFDMDSFLASLGPAAQRISGNIGHTTLKDYVLAIDYSTKTLKLNTDTPSDIPSESWIPFRYVEDTHLIGVPVRINSMDPVDLVLDTGSPVTILTPNLAADIGLELNEGGPMVKGLGGMTQAHMTQLQELSVGNRSHEQAQILVLDLSAVSKRGNFTQYGILGASFFNRYELVIDYPMMNLALL